MRTTGGCFGRLLDQILSEGPRSVMQSRSSAGIAVKTAPHNVALAGVSQVFPLPSPVSLAVSKLTD